MTREVFRNFFNDLESIKFREPLAETLGSFKNAEAVLEYSFTDTVKMAGHACPTVAGAYLICQEALSRLYTGEVPARGEIQITVFGQPDEGVYGVMSQVFTFLTGAAPSSGFRGLGHRYRRKDLLTFSSHKADPDAMSFEFKRLHINHSVLVKFYPHRIPFSTEKTARLQELLEKVIWEAATEDEKKEFQNLWIEKVRQMFMEGKSKEQWLVCEERSK